MITRDEWWKKLNPDEQKGYLRAHQHSKKHQTLKTFKQFSDLNRPKYPKYWQMWGNSHSSSSVITGHSAKLMGIKGYRDLEPTREAERVGEAFLLAIHQSSGSPHSLYHGFNNEVLGNPPWKVGDTVKLPLLAASGDRGHADSYGISYADSPAYDNARAMVFEFPKGTPMAGYTKWNKEDQKDFGYIWDEAIVAGEFRITGTRTEHESGHRALPVQVFTLEPQATFNPLTRQWDKLNNP